jgi:arylsulfatase A-like enzyme
MGMNASRTGTRHGGAEAPTSSLLVIALWFGLTAGLIEVIVLALRHSLVTPIMELSRDFVWMTPLSIAAAILVVSMCIMSIRLIWRHAPVTAGVIFMGILFAALELLLFIPRIHHGAILILAIGLAVQLTRVLLARRNAFASVARKMTPWLAVIVLCLGAGSRGLRILSERKALSDVPAIPLSAANLILITLDTVRGASMSLYGYERSTTPNLDAFARRGTVFERALSTAPWTLPSHASMFTGRWHHEMSTDHTVPLDDEFPTLAEHLASRGYATAGFVANMAYCGYESGLDRGFLHYDDYTVSAGQLIASSNVLRTLANNFRLRRLIRNDEHLNRKRADKQNAAVLGWLDDLEQRPFFMFINYFDAHEPYLPPAPFDRAFGPGRRLGRYSPLHRWLWEPALGHANMGDAELREEIDAYDGALAYLDHQLGVLFAGLDARGLLDNTLVIVTSDHGEEFQEHGVFEHGYSLYRPGGQVPLVMAWPGKVPTGIRVADAVTLRDLPATAVDLLGLERPSPFPGRSLARYWRGAESGGDDEPILSELNHAPGHPDWFPVSKGDMKSVTYRGMRYIRNGDGSEELYDFDNDPWERRDLSPSELHRSEVMEYRNLLDSMLALTATSAGR